MTLRYDGSNVQELHTRVALGELLEAAERRHSDPWNPN